MSLLTPNPLMTLAQGNMTPIGAPPVAAGPTGFQAFSQGLLGNPLFGLGAGLLTGAQPGGTFAGGLNLGLANMLNMQRSQQATALVGARIEELRRKRQAEERQQRALDNLTAAMNPQDALYYQAGLTPPTPQKAQLFTGGVEGRPGERQQYMMVDGEAVPVPGAAPYTPQPQVVIGQADQTIKTSDALNLVNAQGENPPIGMTFGRAAQEGFFAQPQTAQTEYRKRTAAQDRVGRAAREYARVLDEYGTTLRPGEGKARLDSAYTRWQLAEKEAQELGALTGPDIGLLTAQLADPTSWYGNLQGINAVRAQMNDYFRSLETDRASTAQQYRRQYDPIEWPVLGDEEGEQTEQPQVRTVDQPPAWATEENLIQPLGTRRSRRLR